MVPEAEKNFTSIKVTAEYTMIAGCKIKIEYDLNQTNSVKKKTICLGGQKI